MDGAIGLIVALIVLILVSWKGYSKYKKPLLWLAFVPAFSIIHTYLGLLVLALAFQYDSNPEQLPLWASITGPTFIGVGVFGLPLEAIGFSDELAYSMAFGLNAIAVAVLIAFFIQWVQKRKLGKNA
jgi:hypothetical protein